MKPIPAGQSVSGGAKVKAEPDPNCDPTQGPCEMWLPGNYSVVVGKFIITPYCFLYALSLSSLSLSHANISCLQWTVW